MDTGFLKTVYCIHWSVSGIQALQWTKTRAQLHIAVWRQCYNAFWKY